MENVKYIIESAQGSTSACKKVIEEWKNNNAKGLTSKKETYNEEILASFDNIEEAREELKNHISDVYLQQTAQKGIYEGYFTVVSLAKVTYDEDGDICDYQPIDEAKWSVSTN